MLFLWEGTLRFYLVLEGFLARRDNALDSLTVKLDLFEQPFHLAWISLVLNAFLSPPNDAVQYCGFFIVTRPRPKSTADCELVMLTHGFLEPI